MKGSKEVNLKGDSGVKGCDGGVRKYNYCSRSRGTRDVGECREFNAGKCMGVRNRRAFKPAVSISSAQERKKELIREILGLKSGNLEGRRKSVRRKVCLQRGAPSISHLFFADDSLFCFQAEEVSCSKLKEIISNFCRVSREMINLNKSSVCFSLNISEEKKQRMKGILGTPVKESVGKYLGCNIDVNGRKLSGFQDLVDKLVTRVNSWKMSALNQAGKLVLMNAMLVALCSYVVSIFLIPKKVSRKLDSIMGSFWWKSLANGKGIQFLKNDLMVFPKEKGGLGVRRVEYLNLAMLAKHAVRLHNDPNSLLARVYQAKYKGSPVQVVFGNKSIGGASWGFRGLCKGVQACRSGFVRTIGKGDVNLFGERWLLAAELKVKNQELLRGSGIKKVKDLFLSNTRMWNSGLIWSLFEIREARAIMAYQVDKEGEDEYRWEGGYEGKVIAKSFYNEVEEVSV